MRLTRFALALAAGLAISGTAAAHSELHSATWCTNGVVAFAGEFVISAEELHTESNRRQQAAIQRCAEQAGQAPGSIGDGTCGIFDPPYELAVAMARAACGDMQSPMPSAGSPVVVFVADPPTFNDPDHHDAFNLDSGLSGICGFCMSGPPAPKPSAQN